MILKRPSEIEAMAEAGRVNRAALEKVAAAIKPGVSTAELDSIAEDAIISAGGRPAFKGYRGFPGTLNTSINEVVVHGIPGRRRLKEGDLLSVDIGTVYGGFVADQARTYAVGNISGDARRLLDTTEASFWAGLEQCNPGNRLGDVSAAIQDVIEQAGFWVVREFVGHGIGRDMHEGPEVPNFGRAGTGPVLRPGLVLAIEPMVTAKRTRVRVLDDGWTAVTADGCLAAHYEHTVAITEDGPRVLTASDQSPRGQDATGEAGIGGMHGAQEE